MGGRGRGREGTEEGWEGSKKRGKNKMTVWERKIKFKNENNNDN